MEREELNKNLLDFQDLKERWRYQSVRGVRKRSQYDRKFPEPVKVMKNGAKLFWLPHIETYEKLRGKIDVSQNRYTFYETLEEFETKPREEREKQRGCEYSDREWEAIKKQGKQRSR